MATDLHITELTTQLDHNRAKAMRARCSLAFIHGVLDTCTRFKQPLTSALVEAMMKSAKEGLTEQ